MATLREELEETEARAEHLRRRIAAEACAVAGHDWKHIGGRNAACHDDCACSIPVYECTVCKDSDYGENAEANEKMRQCEIRRAEDAEEDRLRAEDDALMPGGFP